MAHDKGANAKERRKGRLTAKQRVAKKARLEELGRGPQEQQRRQSAQVARTARRMNRGAIQRMRAVSALTKEGAEALKGRFTKKAQLGRWEAVYGRQSTKGKEEGHERGESPTAAEENEEDSEGDEGEKEVEDENDIEDGGAGLTWRDDDDDDNDDDEGNAMEQVRPEPLEVGKE